MRGKNYIIVGDINLNLLNSSLIDHVVSSFGYEKLNMFIRLLFVKLNA